MIGKTISHYKILKKIGEGGMGEVYLAEDTKLRRKVALKFLPHGFASDTDALARFKREARAAASLDHPNIITIHDVAEYENRPYIVMAYVEGELLSDLIARKELSLERAIEIASGVCSGLARAHEASVVHRDIKPANIVIATDGQPRILDFGLAKLRGVSKLTQDGSTLGTANYMSPEQARGEDVDHRSDIFSLGAVLYEMITGCRPFRGDHPAAVMYSITNEEPQPLRRFNNQTSEDMERVVTKALTKKADERYQHAGDLLVDLTAVKRSSEARASGAFVSTKSSRFVNPRVMLGGVAAVLTVLGLYFFLPRGGEAPPTESKSIAVLPFQNLSADPENEYFSDGITEDIIAQLSKIADLRVISRTSVMRYKGSGKSVREIGKELGVATLLEGSVRRSQGQVRIVSQLIDARTDEQIWAQTYDRELSAIFKIQSDVAEKIARALEATLTDEVAARIRAAPTASMEAYDYYLRGRESYHLYRNEHNENAIVFYKKALEQDPDYALAYAGLGDAYSQRVFLFGFELAWRDSAMQVSKKAISIDPNLSEGYKALALALTSKGWYKKALESNLKAVELDPNNINATTNVGWTYIFLGRPDKAIPRLRKEYTKEENFLRLAGLGLAYSQLGHWEEAREWINKALEIRPDLADAHAMTANTYLEERRYDEAKAIAQELIQRQPDDYAGYDLMARIEVRTGSLPQARELFARVLEMWPGGDPDLKNDVEHYLACVLWKLSERDQARPLMEQASAWLRNEVENGSEDSRFLFRLAVMEAVQGNKTQALDWLQRAFDMGDLEYLWAERNPFLESIHDDERFKVMAAEVRTRVEEMSRRVREYDQ
jgi:serine/threonine protein kinase/Tfp pilus assembly protein PilF